MITLIDDQIWNASQIIGEDLAQMIAKHTLCGEIITLFETESHVEFKLHVFSELGYVVLAALFAADWNGSLTKLSLSFLIPKTMFQLFLLLHPVIEDSKLFAVVCLLSRIVSVGFKTACPLE